jgi:hypothetical protein
MNHGAMLKIYTLYLDNYNQYLKDCRKRKIEPKYKDIYFNYDSQDHILKEDLVEICKFFRIGYKNNDGKILKKINIFENILRHPSFHHIKDEYNIEFVTEDESNKLKMILNDLDDLREKIIKMLGDKKN